MITGFDFLPYFLIGMLFVLAVYSFAMIRMDDRKKKMDAEADAIVAKLQGKTSSTGFTGPRYSGHGVSEC